MISRELIEAISNKASPAILDGLVAYLPNALLKYEINTPLRVAHFLAQIAEESDGFHVLAEYASGVAYEGRHDLGNTQPGDGPRFKGRGLIMLTGRSNYAFYGGKLGLDLVNQPDDAAHPRVAVLTAALYWSIHGLNAFADKDDITTITRRINGGLNGLSTRELYLARAKAALKTEPVPTADVAAQPAKAKPDQAPMLTRIIKSVCSIWSRVGTS